MANNFINHSLTYDYGKWTYMTWLDTDIVVNNKTKVNTHF